MYAKLNSMHKGCGVNVENNVIPCIDSFTCKPVSAESFLFKKKARFLGALDHSDGVKLEVTRGMTQSFNVVVRVAEPVADMEERDLLLLQTSSPSSDRRIQDYQSIIFLCNTTFGVSAFIAQDAVAGTGLVVSSVIYPLIITIVGVSTYLLAQSSAVLARRGERLVQDPYSRIATIAGGYWVGTIVFILQIFDLFLIVIGFQLCSAEGIANAFSLSDVHFAESKHFHQLLFVAVGILATPMLFVRTLRDYFCIASVGAFASAISCLSVLIFTIISSVQTPLPDTVELSPPSIASTILYASTILFTTLGPCKIVPILSEGMENPDSLGKLTLAASLVMAAFVAVSTIIPWWAVRGHIGAKTLASLQLYCNDRLSGIIFLVCESSRFVHALAAEVVFASILIRLFEKHAAQSHAWKWRHVAVSTLLIAVVTCAGIALPSYVVVFSMVGGATASVLTIILPIYVYLRLFATSSWVRTVFAGVVLFALFFSILSTWSSLKSVLEYYG